MASMSTASISAGGVELERPGREADVADLAGEDPAEVLPVEEPLDLALGGLVDVDAVGVEEADDDRLRVVGARRTVMPARGCDRRRTWKRVTGTVATSRSLDVDPDRVQPTMMARLSTRAARLVSRDAVTVEPFSRVVPRPWPAARPARG